MSRNWWRFAVASFLVALVGALVMAPGIGGGFILDDDHNIARNPLVKIDRLDSNSLMYAAVSFPGGRGLRPIPMASFALDYWRAGEMDPAAFKVTNIHIHALNALLLSWLVLRLLLAAQWTVRRAAIGALVVACLWAVHPLQVSGVLYVVQRMQMLAFLFVMLALLSYVNLRQAQIEGRPGWWHGALSVLWWGVALACKEDAILAPVFALAMELTVLGFRARTDARSFELRRAWTIATVLATLVFLVWVGPHYWSSEPYPGKTFNSAERLLTQARVLVMYLGQSLWPLPSRMPFNYDYLEISRGLLQPVTTLLSIVILVTLVCWAWIWRRRCPVFSFGVFLYLSGHFVTSNVVPLELAFEHRNYLPLVGILLAVLALLALAFQRMQLSAPRAGAITAVALVLVASAGAGRAYVWGDALRLAKYNAEVAPMSPRAWTALGGAYFDLAGRRNARGNPLLDLAIKTVEEGAERTGSASAYSNIVIYKTIQGTVTQADWDRLTMRLERGPVQGPERNIMWTTLTNLKAGIGLDQAQALRVMETIMHRIALSPEDYYRFGVTIFREIDQEAALPYFMKAAETFPSDSPEIQSLCTELAAVGRDAWSVLLAEANRNKSKHERS